MSCTVTLRRQKAGWGWCWGPAWERQGDRRALGAHAAEAAAAEREDRGSPGGGAGERCPGCRARIASHAECRRCAHRKRCGGCGARLPPGAAEAEERRCQGCRGGSRAARGFDWRGGGAARVRCAEVGCPNLLSQALLAAGAKRCRPCLAAAGGGGA